MDQRTVGGGISAKFKDAYLHGRTFHKISGTGSFDDSSLHVVGYSTPVTTTLPLSALKEHIFTLPDQVRKEIQVKTDIRDRTIAEIEKLQKVDEMQIEIDVLQQSEHGIYLLKERYVKLTQ